MTDREDEPADADPPAAAHQRRAAQTIADVTVELDRVARQIDTAVHETVNMSAAIMGSLQLLLKSLRRIADRLEQDLDTLDHRQARWDGQERRTERPEGGR